MNHQIDHGNEDHTFTTAWQRLVVFGQSTVFSEPRKGPFYNPAFRQHHESADRLTRDDLDITTEPAAHPMHELPRIAAVREDQLQSAEACAQLTEEQLAAVAILKVRGMHEQGDDQPEGVDDQMTLATAYLLARIVPPVPPFSAVLTDWLSRMPTLGVGHLPACRRTRERRQS